MIEIKVEHNRITVRGHAGYAEPGKDIVCAAVSILVATFINVCDADIIEDEQDYMELEWKEGTDTAFFMTGLELVQNTYPGYIKII